MNGSANIDGSESSGVDVIEEAAIVERFAYDPDPPKRLYAIGDRTLCDQAAVAIVGTRQCTEYGVAVTRELSMCLAEADVAVVSGLALGIDAAAHAGVLAAGGAAIAVVGSGLDVVYPHANGPLWREVSRTGLLLSEYPDGTRPERWRFPARNRIIAGLADIVVVVESHIRGGSLSTAAEAVARDKPVFAVPGPIRSPASDGTNRLIADGANPLCEPDDVLIALGMVRQPVPGSSSTSRSGEPDFPADSDADTALGALGHEPRTIEQLALATGLDLRALAAAVDELDRAGVVVRRNGWIERA